MSMETVLPAAGNQVSPFAAAIRAKFDRPVQADVTSWPAGAHRAGHGRAAAGGKITTRNIDIDAETRTVVFQTVNASNGQVVAQFPSEAALNLRAYLAAARSEGAGSASLVRLV